MLPVIVDGIGSAVSAFTGEDVTLVFGRCPCIVSFFVGDGDDGFGIVPSSLYSIWPKGDGRDEEEAISFCRFVLTSRGTSGHP